MPDDEAATTALKDTPGPLAGLRVVELAGGLAIADCAKLFAQAGAEVIRIEPPGGDEIRQAGPFRNDKLDLDSGGFHRTLNGGKRSVTAAITTEHGAAVAAQLIEGADILVASWRLDAAHAQLPLADPELMRERFPELIYLSISPFGMTGPRKDDDAEGHIFEALAGMSYVSGDPDREPLPLGFDVAEHFAAAHGWIAAQIALAERRADRDVHFVDLSIHEAMAMSDDHNLTVYLGNGAVRRRYYSRILPSYPTDVMACKDGYIAFVPRGARVDFPQKMAALINRPDIVDNPLFTTMQERVLRWRDFDAIVAPWLESHTVDEVLTRSDELAIGLAGVPTIRDLVEDPHLAFRGFWQQLADGTTQPGPGARFGETPLQVRPAPDLGAHDATPDWRSPRPPRPEPTHRGRGAFEGMRVVDFTQGWVGPLVTRILADLGADVVKIERSGSPGGAYTNRTLFPVDNEQTGDHWNRNIYFTVRNAGKRGVMIDGSSDEGHGLLLKLIDGADVLVENFLPHVMESLRLDYDRLHERSPDLVMISISGWGQDGPYANRPAVGMTMEPAAGATSITGYPDGIPMKTGQTWVDPYVGLYATGAMLAAIAHRDAGGGGQHVDVSMLETTIPLLAWYIADETLNGRAHRGIGARRPGIVRDAYRCDGDDEWVALTARDDDGWRALCDVIGQRAAIDDARFADSAARDAHHDDIHALISAWTIGRSKFDATDALQRAGVAAGPVLHADEVLADPQLAAREFFDRVAIPGVGPVPIQRYVPAKFDGRGVAAGGPAPGLGEHTDEVLAELGVEAEERGRLREARVVDGGPELWSNPVSFEGSRLPYELYREMGSVLRIDPRPA